MVQRIHNSLFILRKGMILCVIIAVLAAITGFMMMKPLDLQDKENALQQCYCIAYPVCVMLLYTITFMPFVYSPSRELFYIAHRIKWVKTIIPFLYLSLLMCAITSLLFFRTILYPERFIAKNLIIIYCFCGLYYGTVYTAKNITIAIILSFTLIILSLSGGNLFNAIIPWYIDVHSVKTLASFMKEYIILGSAGCILGLFSNHRYSDYQ